MHRNEVPDSLANVPCEDFGPPAAVTGLPLARRKVALISTAGLQHAGDRPFALGSADYRIIDADDERPLQMSHISTNFDRSGFAQDLNLVFPLERLQELEREGTIGSAASLHYSFMGATEPEKLQSAASDLAAVLKGDAVDLACLLPV